MLNKTDKLIEVRLYTSHVCDYLFERADGTFYVYMNGKEGKKYHELHKTDTGTGWILGEQINL